MQRNYRSDEELAKLKAIIAPITSGFDMIDDHIVITDVDGNIVYANEAVEAHTGFSMAEILGKNPGDLWGGHMTKTVYEDMWKTIKAGKHWSGTINNVRKDGVSYNLEAHITPIVDHDGKIIGFVGFEPDKPRQISTRYNQAADDLYGLIIEREIRLLEVSAKLDALQREQKAQ